MGYLEQYGVLFVALLLGGGFAFGGIASYSGLVDTGSSNNQESNFTLPEQHFQEKDFEMSFRERRQLAYTENLIFATGYYTDSDGKESLKQLRSIQDIFGDSMYYNVVNASESTVPVSESQIDSYPILVIIGGNQNGPTAFIEDPTEDNFGSSSCGVVRTIETLSESGRTYCATR